MNDRFKEITDDILDKLSKGYVFDPARLQQVRNGSMTTNSAEATIEKPFAEAEDAPLLTADNIVTRTEKDGETIAYEVVQDEKLLFSTVSRPLAFAFVTGWNGKAGKGAVKPSEEDDAEADTSNPETKPAKVAAVDPADVSASKDRRSGSSGDNSTQPVPQPRKRSVF